MTRCVIPVGVFGPVVFCRVVGFEPVTFAVFSVYGFRANEKPLMASTIATSGVLIHTDESVSATLLLFVLSFTTLVAFLTLSGKEKCNADGTTYI